MTAGTVLPAFFAIGIAFIPLGIALLVTANNVSSPNITLPWAIRPINPHYSLPSSHLWHSLPQINEVTVDYTTSCKPTDPVIAENYTDCSEFTNDRGNTVAGLSCDCTVQFELDQDFRVGVLNFSKSISSCIIPHVFHRVRCICSTDWPTSTRTTAGMCGREMTTSSWGRSLLRMTWTKTALLIDCLRMIPQSWAMPLVEPLLTASSMVSTSPMEVVESATSEKLCSVLVCDLSWPVVASIYHVQSPLAFYGVFTM